MCACFKAGFALAGSSLPPLPTHRQTDTQTRPAKGLAAALDMIFCLPECCWLRNGREVIGKWWVREVSESLSSIRRDLLIHTFQKRYSGLGEKSREGSLSAEML